MRWERSDSRKITGGAYLLALALTAAACAGIPAHLAGPAAPDPFTCALRQLDAMDYTVALSDRRAGIIRADREKRGAMETMTSAFGGANYDELQVMAAGDSIRVTASRVNSYAASARRQRPRKEALADARALLKACAHQ